LPAGYLSDIDSFETLDYIRFYDSLSTIGYLKAVDSKNKAPQQKTHRVKSDQKLCGISPWSYI